MGKSLRVRSAIALFFLAFAVVETYARLEVIQSWRYLQFKYDSLAEEAQAILNGTYDYTKNIPIDVLPSPDGRIFLSVRRDIGVPATLTTVEKGKKGDGGGPLLRPYPDWTWADPKHCTNIIGVYRMDMDSCNRLWVIDSGKVGDRTVCQPKILAFDTKTNKAVRFINLPKFITFGPNGRTQFENIVVETEGKNCAKTTVYMADSEGYGIVIWNGRAFWRVSSEAFEPDPQATIFRVAGSRTIQNSHGVIGMAVTMEPSPLDRHMYFRPLSSYHMYDVKIVDLHRYRKNRTRLSYTKEPIELPSQSITHTLANQRVLFFSSIKDSSILCWNRKKEFTSENVATVARNPVSLGWASGLKVLPKNDPKKGKLWVLTNRWQNFQGAPPGREYWEFMRVNFRILSGNVKDLINGTVCA